MSRGQSTTVMRSSNSRRRGVVGEELSFDAVSAMPCMEVLDIPMHLGCASLESRLPFLFGVGSGSETMSAQESSGRK